MHTNSHGAEQSKLQQATSMSIEWYADGQTRTVEIGGVRVIIRFVGRRGRRGRIAITAPAGAVFRSAAV